MSRRVLVVVAHPVKESFIGAAAQRAVQALRQRGDEVEVIDLYGEGFEPVVSLSEWMAMTGKAGAPSVVLAGDHEHELDSHQRRLAWCDALVLVYPTWFGSQPAMLKGWFDRAWVEGVAYRLPTQGGRLRPLLTNIRSITVITTHGSSKTVNGVQGEPGKRVALRGLRSLCHPLCRTRWIAFYGNDHGTEQARSAFLGRVERQLLDGLTSRHDVT